MEIPLIYVALDLAATILAILSVPYIRDHARKGSLIQRLAEALLSDC